MKIETEDKKKKTPRPPISAGAIRGLIILGLLAAVLVIVTVLLWPYISSLATKEGIDSLKAYARGLGVGGWFITLGIQVLQIVVAFLPGEPVELMLGAVWGPLFGTLTCLRNPTWLRYHIFPLKRAWQTLRQMGSR